jgi:hypothetical protein
MLFITKCSIFMIMEYNYLYLIYYFHFAKNQPYEIQYLFPEIFVIKMLPFISHSPLFAFFVIQF